MSKTKTDLIIEKINDVKNQTNRIEDNVRRNTENIQHNHEENQLTYQRIEHEIKKINLLDENQNKSLEEHIAGVKSNTSLILKVDSEVEKRLKRLEKPKLYELWVKTTFDLLIKVGMLGSSVYVALRLFGVI